MSISAAFLVDKRVIHQPFMRLHIFNGDAIDEARQAQLQAHACQYSSDIREERCGANTPRVHVFDPSGRSC
jgi:hypothetical protein